MDSFSEGEQDDVTSGGGCVKVFGGGGGVAVLNESTIKQTP